MKTIRISIDGKEIEASEGQSVLDAALEAGIYIPHLCSHPDLAPAGNCRLCVVQIEGVEGIQTSCETICRDGMRVITKSEKLRHLRNVALELMLAGHPHDCTSCKAYLKCELQALMQYQSVVHARMHTIKRETASLISRDPMIIREPERCISCGRCVRACRDLRGIGVLDFYQMNGETYVGTKDRQPLSGLDCRFCGACVEVCPTGALQDAEGVFRNDLPKSDALVPCQAECPAKIDIPSYVRLVGEGNFGDAVAVIREKVPFPYSLGFVLSLIHI
jgi:NADH dehydrogenase/NADH:ubiquinone oxidoreductase subunit G